MSISNSPLTITRGHRSNTAAPGDACLDPDNGQFYVYVDSYVGWMLVDSCGNKKTIEEQEREEAHAKFPQLAKLWEEYQLMKKLCVGDNPRKDNAKR